TTYAYDGDGKRVSLMLGATGPTTTYVSDVNRSLPVVLEETTGGTTRKYVWGLGLAYAVQVVSGTEQVEVYHTDGLGSVRAVTDDAAEVVRAYDTDEFGVPTVTQGAGEQPFRYEEPEPLRLRRQQPGDLHRSHWPVPRSGWPGSALLHRPVHPDRH
ncbi:MAG: hypothetical protein HYY04_06380, partial [Chloroflexi bacterium]|nr:hypothetical protein [Chloroflexota bacterium]